MNENDHRKRSRKQNKRRRKAREREHRQATRGDFRWQSHMLKLMELQLDNPRPAAHRAAQAHVAHSSPVLHSGSDDDKASGSPSRFQARTPQRRRGKTPRKRSLPEGHNNFPAFFQAEQQQGSPGEAAMIGSEKQVDSSGLELSPKSVKLKLEEGGWTRLPALSNAQADGRRASKSLPSPWWGNRQRQRFGASRARVNFTTEAERDHLRVQKWAEVGAMAMGLESRRGPNRPPGIPRIRGLR